MQKTVLVTGASGFIGQRIVAALKAADHRPRALVRASSRKGALERAGIELVVGDMQYADSLASAIDGVDAVVHAAADTSGTEDGGQRITIDGTRTLVELCASRGIRLVYVSSCSVYGIADLDAAARVDEDSPLEPRPRERGAYSWAKHAAEGIVTAAIEDARIDAVNLRPGFVYGPGGDLINPMIGFGITDRLLLAIGPAGFVLPLVHVDNVASAVVASLADSARGRTYNLIDPDLVSKREYIDRYVRPQRPGLRVIYLPKPLLTLTIAVQELVFKLLRRPPVLSRYRFASSQNPVRFVGERIGDELDWVPDVRFEDAADAVLTMATSK
ncbi:MAG: NAD-dependent epimerase/dehydratase family protein [Woeseiaceae bacterium]|nr:NAD-dependent epimerase/dehydratase family protein [Woeseiaceae bacterium]